MLNQWLWIMVCYAEPVVDESWCVMLRPVVVNHGVLCWASGCESWCVILSQWFWTSETVVCVLYGVLCLSQWLFMLCYSDGVLCWASGCESWLLYYAEPVIVNHGVLCLFVNHCVILPVVVNHGVVMLSQWLWIMVCYAEAVCCESWCVILRQWLWIMVCYAEPVVSESSCSMVSPVWIIVMWAYAEPVVVNHGVLWIMDEPVVVNHVNLSQWCEYAEPWARLWIMVCYMPEPVVVHIMVNHGVCWASGCESWWL